GGALVPVLSHPQAPAAHTTPIKPPLVLLVFERTVFRAFRAVTDAGITAFFRAWHDPVGNRTVLAHKNGRFAAPFALTCSQVGDTARHYADSPCFAFRFRQDWSR